MITRMDVLGGAQTHLMNLSKMLAENGHEVFIMHGGKLHEAYHIKHPRITFITVVHLVHPLHPFEDVKAIKEVRQRFRFLRPDIVALHSSKAGTIGRIAAKSMHIPSVFTAHGWSFTEGIPRKKQQLYRLIEQRLAKRTDAIIAVSNYDANLARKAHILPKHGLHVIHNGILKMKKPSVPRKKNIVMVARFQLPKRQDLLLRAFALLEDKATTLTLVGDGPTKIEAEKLAETLGIKERVIFTGDQQNVTTYLEEASIFVLMSNFEGLPISIIEAMAAALPIIASNVGGVSELVATTENGFLVDNESQELQLYLTKLLKDESLREKMGQESRILFEQAFQFQHTYEKTIAIYERVRC